MRQVLGDTAIVKPQLEVLAGVALDAGGFLMEAGASARNVAGIVEMVARGLGAERLDLRIGYASLALTLAIGESTVTRIRQVGPLGVDQRLNQRLWRFARRVSVSGLTVDGARAELARLAADRPRHSPWVTAVAVGAACAAFGRLLMVDWRGTGPVLIAAAMGQYLRSRLLARKINVFLCTALVSFLSSLLAGVGAYWIGSDSLATASIASVLLLVPGVPALNAQADILEGRPTLGCARLVSVAMTLIFMTAGLWFQEALLEALLGRH